MALLIALRKMPHANIFSVSRRTFPRIYQFSAHYLKTASQALTLFALQDPSTRPQRDIINDLPPPLEVQ